MAAMGGGCPSVSWSGGTKTDETVSLPATTWFAMALDWSTACSPQSKPWIMTHTARRGSTRRRNCFPAVQFVPPSRRAGVDPRPDGRWLACRRTAPRQRCGCRDALHGESSYALRHRQRRHAGTVPPSSGCGLKPRRERSGQIDAAAGRQADADVDPGTSNATYPVHEGFAGSRCGRRAVSDKRFGGRGRSRTHRTLSGVPTALKAARPTGDDALPLDTIRHEAMALPTATARRRRDACRRCGG